MNFKTLIGFAVGPLGSAAIGLITVPLIAWLFSPEDVGRMNLLQITLSFTLLLSVLGLDQAYVREYHGSKNLPNLLRACFVPGFTILLVCTVITISFGRDIALLLYGFNNPFLYLLTLICIYVNYISRFLTLILRMQERGLAYSLSQLLPKILQLIMFGIIALSGMKQDFFTLLMIYVVSTSAVTLTNAWNTRYQWKPALKMYVDFCEYKKLLKYGLPLVFSGLSYWGLTAASTLILRKYSNLGEIAVYSVTSSISGAVIIFQSIFTVVWAPMVYKWLNDGVDMKRIDSIAGNALIVVLVIFGIVGSLSWLTDYILPHYYSNVKYFVVCAIVPPLLYTLSEISSIGIAISRRTTFTVWIALTALLVNILMGLWLVPKLGAAGAVIGNAVAYMVFFTARTEVSAYVWKQFPRSKTYLLILIVVTLAIVNVLLGKVLNYYLPIIWLLLLSILLIIFKNKINKTINYIKKHNK